MEAPVQISGENSSNYVRNSKVNVLKSIKEISLDDIVLGQYIG